MKLLAQVLVWKNLNALGISINITCLVCTYVLYIETFPSTIYFYWFPYFILFSITDCLSLSLSFSHSLSLSIFSSLPHLLYQARPAVGFSWMWCSMQTVFSTMMLPLWFFPTANPPLPFRMLSTRLLSVS